MADITTRWSTELASADFTLSPADQVIWTDEDGRSINDENGRAVGLVFTPGDGLLAGDDLFTAVLISLFTDAAAESDDVQPDGSDDPRGWWAGPIGSKLWLRARSRATPLTLALFKTDIEQALAWMLADDIVASIDVSTEWVRAGLLGARVLFLRHDGSRRALAFARVWEDI